MSEEFPLTASGFDYAARVVSGKEPAGEMVIGVCQRHVADLERSDIEFDFAASERVLKFLSTLRLSGGEYHGKRMVAHAVAVLRGRVALRLVSDGR